MPFEVKYRATSTGAATLKGLSEFCDARGVGKAYVITKDIGDFGVLRLSAAGQGPLVLRIPAPLACYWLGQSELGQTAASD